MRRVELVLTSKVGKVLWRKTVSIPDSGSISLGRCSLFDEVCESFAASEWAMISIRSDFVGISSSFGMSFGIGRAELAYRRNRRLFCKLFPDVQVSSQSFEDMVDFKSKHQLDMLPEVETYIDPNVRSVLEDLLMNADVFNDKGLVQDFVTPHYLASALSLRMRPEVGSEKLPQEHLKRFVSVFWAAASYVYAEGPLTRWLRSGDFQEILFNGFDECWIERSGILQRRVSPFLSWDDLQAWLSRYAMLAGVDLVNHRGCADFALPCGARVHVALGQVAQREGYVSIRCHRQAGFSLVDLVNSRSIKPTQAETIERWIGERKNILVAGATSSGKTTLVSALLGSVSTRERIVVLEDVPELKVKHDHVVYLQTFESLEPDVTRSISLESLVREALRMRPDRLVVGECRGNEAFALVQALHTGHRGSISTVHANSAKDALTRLETLMIRAEPSLDARVVKGLIQGAFDAVIFVERHPVEGRRVSGLHLVQELIEQ